MSATQPLPDGPVGTLVRNSYAFGAEPMLYRIREGTYRGKKRRIHDNKLPNAALPLYGYEFADAGKTRYVIDDRTAPVVQRIFAMALAGFKLRQMSVILTSEGILTPTQYHRERGWPSPHTVAATVWNHPTIHKILTNSAYAGRYVGFRTQKQTKMSVHPVTGENTPVDRMVVRDENHPDRVVYGEDVCPRLVDDETFEAVQLILERNKVESSRRLAHPEALLLRNGFAQCGYCGGNMVGSWRKAAGYHVYTCARRQNGSSNPCPTPHFSRKAADMDMLMWQAVITVFERPEVVAAKYAEYKADKEDGLAIERDRLAMLETMLQDAERKRRLNMQLAGDEEDDEQRAEYQHIATEAARSIRGINVEIETLKSVLASKRHDDETLESLASLGAQAAERLREADFDDRRRTLLALDAKLYIRRKGDSNAVEFECRLSERFDPTALSVQSHLWQLPT